MKRRKKEPQHGHTQHTAQLIKFGDVHSSTCFTTKQAIIDYGTYTVFARGKYVVYVVLCCWFTASIDDTENPCRALSVKTVCTDLHSHYRRTMFRYETKTVRCRKHVTLKKPGMFYRGAFFFLPSARRRQLALTRRSAAVPQLSAARRPEDSFRDGTHPCRQFAHIRRHPPTPFGQNSNQCISEAEIRSLLLGGWEAQRAHHRAVTYQCLTAHLQWPPSF